MRSFVTALLLTVIVISASPSDASADTDLIVGFKHGLTDAEKRHLVVTAGGDPSERLRLIDGYVVTSDGSYGAVAERLGENRQVKFVSPDSELRLDAVPNDPAWSSASSEPVWAFQNIDYGTADADIDADEAWNIGTGSRSVVVAVIDTGADVGHPDLGANIWVNPGEIPGNGIDDDSDGLVDDYNGYDFGDNDSDVTDEGGSETGHGTLAAGIIGAVGNNGVGVAGVNWQVQVMVLKFSGREPPVTGQKGVSRRVSDMLRALDFAVQRRVTAVNTSFGGGSVACNNAALQAGMNAAETAGLLVVSSAGNEAANTDIFPHCPSSLPNNNIIAVANSNQDDNLAPSSSYGKQTVDLAAPGTHINSTFPGGRYAYASGTSFSAPFVTGVAALAKSLRPQASATDLRSAILASVDQKPQLAELVATGGRLNACRALPGCDQAGPTATLLLNGGERYTRTRRVTARFRDVNDASGVATMSFSVAGQPFGEPAPFAQSSAIWLDKKEGERMVAAELADTHGYKSTVQGSIVLDRTPPRRRGFRIRSIEVKRRGRNARRPVIQWIQATDAVSGTDRYKLFMGKSKSDRLAKCQQQDMHVLKTVAATRAQVARTVLGRRGRGRYCLKVVAVDKAGNRRSSAPRSFQVG